MTPFTSLSPIITGSWEKLFASIIVMASINSAVGAIEIGLVLAAFSLLILYVGSDSRGVTVGALAEIVTQPAVGVIVGLPVGLGECTSPERRKTISESINADSKSGSVVSPAFLSA
jgi:hypothetical protein